MGMFGNFFKGLFSAVPEAEPVATDSSSLFGMTPETLSASRRRTERHPTRSANVVWITVGGRHRINVQNISYGGLALQCEMDQLKPFFSDDGMIEVVLHIYHMELPCRLNALYHSGSMVGCAFVHDNEKTLLFLRKSLEFFRVGNSMVPLPKEIVKSEFQEPRFACYHGTPATDLILQFESEKHEQIQNIQLSFRDGAITSKLTYDQNGFHWLRYDGKEETSPLPLEQAFFIMLGMYEKLDVKALGSIITAFERELDRFYPQQKLSSVI